MEEIDILGRTRVLGVYTTRALAERRQAQVPNSRTYIESAEVDPLSDYDRMSPYKRRLVAAILGRVI